MNYSIKYPAAVAQKSAGYHEPHRSLDVEVEPNIWFVGRYYACSVCRATTPFIIDIDECVSHVCSDECSTQTVLNHNESHPGLEPNEKNHVSLTVDVLRDDEPPEI